MKKGPPGSLGDLLGIKYYPVLWGELKLLYILNIKQPVIRGKLYNQFFFRDSIYTGTVKKFSVSNQVRAVTSRGVHQ